MYINALFDNGEKMVQNGSIDALNWYVMFGSNKVSENYVEAVAFILAFTYETRKFNEEWIVDSEENTDQKKSYNF